MGASGGQHSNPAHGRNLSPGRRQSSTHRTEAWSDPRCKSAADRQHHFDVACRESRQWLPMDTNCDNCVRQLCTDMRVRSASSSHRRPRGMSGTSSSMFPRTCAARSRRLGPNTNAGIRHERCNKESRKVSKTNAGGCPVSVRIRSRINGPTGGVRCYAR